MCIPTISNRFTDLSVNKNNNSTPSKSIYSLQKEISKSYPSQSNKPQTINNISDLRKILKDDSSPVSDSIENLFNKGLSANSQVDNDTLPADTISLLGKTPTGASVYSHNDAKQGNTSITTDYLCGHVFRSTSEAKGTAGSNLKYSGFIHMSENANKEQYFDVLGTGIKGTSDKFKNKDNITIMVTGFTPFQDVTDNPTSRFLLGDGTSTDPSSLGFKPPAASDMDNMMRQQFGNFVREPAPYYASVNDQQVEAGRTYTITDPNTNKPKVINLATVRLPVDIEFRDGDDTGDTLRNSISSSNPDAILSFGAGTPGDSNYYVETRSYGVTGANQGIHVGGGEDYRYRTNQQFIENNDFSDIYKRQLRK